MHRNSIRHTQQRVRRGARRLDAGVVWAALSAPELQAQVEPLWPAYRERVFAPMQTLLTFVMQALSADRSCQNAVNATALRRLGAGLAPCSSYTGAFCKARERLPVESVRTLVPYLGQQLTAGAAQCWHWRGRRVRLVDGTTVQLADTVANQRVYPQPPTQQPGLGFPLCRLVGIVCLGSGAVLDVATGACQGKGGDEQSLLRSMLNTLQCGEVLVGDALYATYFLICALRERGVDAVFEQHGARQRTTDFRRGRRLGERDHLVVWPKPSIKPEWMSALDYQQAPQSLEVRELRAGGKTLVTTLLCHRDTSKAELRALFAKRWHVELDLRNIKTTLGMERLSCRTPAMAEKEIWVYMLAYNLVRLLMMQAALYADLLPRQISFKHALQVCNAWTHQTLDGNAKLALEPLLALVAQQRVGDRPGRIEPRTVKRRPKPYALLSEPRSSARARIQKCGHPGKLK